MIFGAATSPVPQPTTTPVSPPKIDLTHIIGPVFHGFWAEITSSVWTIGAFVIFVALVGIRAIHAFAYPQWSRDKTRGFPREVKAEILRRAGQQCEFHSLLGRRCKETSNLEADHVIPWSRSGQTILTNGQALCRQHNRTKRATIPFKWQLRNIAKRRANYYPAGVPGTVNHRRPRR